MSTYQNYQNQNSDIAKSQNAAPRIDSDASQLQKLPFHLQSGEIIVRELKPQFMGFMLTKTLGSYVALAALTIFAIIGAIVFNELYLVVTIGIVAVPAIALIIGLGPYIAYGKSWYWITNRRVVGKRGFFGYSVDSIPLDNVTDVVLTRTLLDRLLGLSSLMIVPMSSSSTGRSRENSGAEDSGSQTVNFFPALPGNTAMDLQRVLFNLRDELRNSHSPRSAQVVSGSSPPESSETVQHKSVLPRSTT